ncbi:MAG: hypothetical protein KGL93_14110 [Gemmatimonadota bacterium]|nr:hypothetical protein [Gemmatimonadota bacterium]
MNERAAQYVLDKRDRIEWVNDAWRQFAEANGAPSLADGVIGTELWRYVAGPETQAIYRTLFDRAREGREIRVPYRCDSPTMIRDFELTVSRVGDAGLRCETRVVEERSRPPIVLLDAAAPRADGLIHMCGWCKRVKLQDWVDAEDAVNVLGLFTGGPVPQITHGICPECMERVLAAMG